MSAVRTHPAPGITVDTDTYEDGSHRYRIYAGDHLATVVTTERGRDAAVTRWYERRRDAILADLTPRVDPDVNRALTNLLDPAKGWLFDPSTTRWICQRHGLSIQGLRDRAAAATTDTEPADPTTLF